MALPMIRLYTGRPRSGTLLPGAFPPSAVLFPIDFPHGSPAPMDPTLLLLRWAHILGAAIAVGGLFFARFALLPAIAEVDEATRDGIHERVRKGWLPWVIGAITLLLVSGLANFLLFNARVKAEGWADGQWMRETGYHALFGVKFLLALVVFYFASGLVGRGGGTEWIRNDRAKWLTVTLGLSVAVIMISGWMRQLHTGPTEFFDAGVRLGGATAADGFPQAMGDPDVEVPDVREE